MGRSKKPFFPSFQNDRMLRHGWLLLTTLLMVAFGIQQSPCADPPGWQNNLKGTQASSKPPWLAASPGSKSATRGGSSLAGDNNHYRRETINADTRWTLRLQENPKVSSSVIRIGDVVRFVGRPPAAWNRVARQAITLVPMRHLEVTLRRDSISKMVEQTIGTPKHIAWIGSDSTTVRRVERSETTGQRSPTTSMPASKPMSHAWNQSSPSIASVANASRSSMPMTPERPRVQPVQYESMQAPYSTNDLLVSDEVPIVNEADRLSIERRIRTLLRRAAPNQLERATPEIDVDPQFIPSIRSRGFSGIEQDPALKDRWYLGWQALDGTIRKTPVTIRWKPFPEIVTLVRQVPAGYRIRQSDIQTTPIRPDRFNSSFVSDASFVVGKETRQSLRADAPISPSAIGEPILVRRSEWVEISVVGGGVTITTNAKALEDGTESQLIEVETVSPRKRLLARVVAAGQVEIMTRSPRVK